MDDGHRRRTGKLYVPLDTDYWRNPRMMTVGPNAELLYVRALCFAKETLSDGYLSAGQVRLFADGVSRKWRVHADKLVGAGLWEATDDGRRITGFLERNRSRAEVEVLSETRAEAGRVGGVRSGESRSNRGESSSNLGESEATPKQLASQNPRNQAEPASRIATKTNTESESETESSLRDDLPQTRNRDPVRDAFTFERDKATALKDGNGEPVDALKRRCLAIFAAKGVSRDDCVRAVDRLRAENIADELIDVALGQCEKNPDVRHVGYLLKVARDWYRQRTGVPT
jgi:hypothetical protein